MCRLQLATPFSSPVAPESGSGRSQGNSTPTDQVVEKPVHMNNDTKVEFSSSIRAEVAKEHKDAGVGLEV